MSKPTLSELSPRETMGRDTIARFQAQFRAAAYECLAILTGQTIDRVYCDYQDDFVTRRVENGEPLYHFYQVKTKNKRNYRWTKLDLFGLYKKKKKQEPSKLAASFVGKLIVHTVRFNTSCGGVVFLTNVNFDDDVEAFISALSSKDFSNADLKAFAELFNDAFVEGTTLDVKAIEEKLGKLALIPAIGYLNPHDKDFGALAREAIYKYSEIDLKRAECEEIIRSLLDLVEQKSFAQLIGELDEAALDDAAGIGIADMLEILSISKGAYSMLLGGGDAKAIKNASIIQRKLAQGGAAEELIEYCSKCKVSWDIWLRDKRHSVPEYELNDLLDDLNGIKNKWVNGAVSFSEVKAEVDALWTKLTTKGLTGTMSIDVVLGGVFAALVRSEAQ